MNNKIIFNDKNIYNKEDMVDLGFKYISMETNTENSNNKIPQTKAA